MILALAATYFEVALNIIYLAELNMWVDNYLLLDGARPTIFGFFAVSQVGALLTVSLMWADVYAKSVKMGAGDNTIAKLRKVVGVIIGLTFFVVVGGMVSGLVMVAGAWCAILIIAITWSYWTKGRALATLLAPSDPDAPGSSSAKGASDAIHSTSVQITYANCLFLLGLGAHFVTVQRPATGPVSMLAVFVFLTVAVLHQNKMLQYVQFGNRKKLAKIGYNGFRASLMTTVGSTVSTDSGTDSSASTASTMMRSEAS